MVESLGHCSPHECVAEAFYAQVSDHPTSRTVGNPEVIDFTHRPATVDLWVLDRLLSFRCAYTVSLHLYVVRRLFATLGCGRQGSGGSVQESKMYGIVSGIWSVQ